MQRNDILFMCVANSARSQMAEAIARSIAPDDVSVYSAGSQPSQVNLFATRALQEIGLATDGHSSKGISDVPMESIRWIITLCDEEVCPYIPGEIERLHWPHPDPAGRGVDPESTLAGFRAVRDAIRMRIEDFFASAN